MKRAISNAPTPEIARSKGRRFAVLQEPSEDEKMNVGLMKELTGGDKIIARQLHKEPIEFKPQFKMVLTCNHLPNVPSDDGGTWRRIRVVEFTSKFCENPNPDNPNEFMIDKDLCKNFDDWKEHFMALLLNYYKKYVGEGIKEPDEVLKCTRDYQRSNDIMMDFMEQEIEKVPGDDRSQASLSEIFSRFQSWIKDNAPQMKNAITKKTLKATLEKTLGKLCRSNGVEVFKECKLRSHGIMFGNEEDLLDV
jgi:P4 family phage/plasmid primase-like protien